MPVLTSYTVTIAGGGGGGGGVQFLWNVVGPPPAPVTGASFATTAGPKATANPLGAGIVRPFRRTEKADFASDSGPPEVASAVGQILGTRKGSLPWRPEFGSDIELLRHMANDPTLVELARIYVEEPLRRWEPRIQLTDVSVTPITRDTLNVITVVVNYRIGGNGAQQNISITF
jgi:phage baseplate assembly protein W